MLVNKSLRMLNYLLANVFLAEISSEIYLILFQYVFMIEVLVCFYKVAAINCLVCHFCPKKGVSGWAEAKKFGFFEKKKYIYILSVGYLTCSAKQLVKYMLFELHQYIIKIKVKKFVYVPQFLCIFICVTCIYYLCLYSSVFIYIKILINTHK